MSLLIFENLSFINRMFLLKVTSIYFIEKHRQIVFIVIRVYASNKKKLKKRTGKIYFFFKSTMKERIMYLYDIYTAFMRYL